jgi:hypothetical protein
MDAPTNSQAESPIKILPTVVLLISSSLAEFPREREPTTSPNASLAYIINAFNG